LVRAALLWLAVDHVPFGPNGSFETEHGGGFAFWVAPADAPAQYKEENENDNDSAENSAENDAYEGIF
jgi:hypothetical protein